MSPKFARFVLKNILGWHFEQTVPIPEKKAIVLTAPHTSLYDFVIGYFFYRTTGGKLHIMIKKEAFFFPLGPLLKSFGGFPMDRKHPQSIMMNLIKAMEENDVFQMAICPEGTRKAVHKWKTGYHTIAKHTGAALYMGYFDYATKTVGYRKCPVELTDDARKDTDAIQAEFGKMKLTALHPEMYVTE